MLSSKLSEFGVEMYKEAIKVIYSVMWFDNMRVGSRR